MKFFKKMRIIIFFCLIACVAHANAAAEMRDPFARNLIARSDLSSAATDLSGYDLNQLAMLGSMQVANKFYAVVADPSGKAYTIKLGDKLSHNQLEVVEIKTGQLAIKNLSDNHAFWVSLPADGH